MKTPDSDALRFAAEWLRAYDDSHDGGEQSAVAEAVAKWLDEQAGMLLVPRTSPTGRNARVVAARHESGET